ncbi:MAG: HTH domain-containing protein, partial [Peptostreptococcaceae bacterium]
MLQQIKSRQKILLKLLIEENLYRPASYFSEQLNVSEKTIYNDIKEINKLLGKEEVSIEKVPRKGLRLLGNREFIEGYCESLKNHNKNLVNSYLPVARQIEIMKILIIDGEKVSYETLSKMFLISVTSIRNDLEDIKENFKIFDARIKSDNTGTFVDGNEVDIQKVLKNFIFNVLEKKLIQNNSLTYEFIKESLKNIFSSNLIDCVIKVIDDIVLINNPKMSDYYLNSLYVTTLILTSR